MFNSLRSKLILFFSFVTFVPLLIVGIIMYQYQHEDLSEQMTESLEKASENRAEGLETFLMERKRNLEYLAKDPTITDVDAGDEEVQQALMSFQETYPYFLNTIFMSNENVTSIHKQEKMEQLLIDEPEWYIHSRQEGTGFSDFKRDFYGEPTFVLSQAVYDQNDDFIGSVASFVNLTEIRNQLNQSYQTVSESERSEYAFLINGHGDIVSHPNRELVLNNNYFAMNDFDKSRFLELVESKEPYYNSTNQMIQFFRPLTMTDGFEGDWFVAVSVPQDHLLSNQQQLLITYLGLFGIVFILTLLAVLKLSNFIVTPLKQLVVATSNFAFSHKVDPITQGYYQEADTLNRAFKMMTTKLIERERNHQKSSLILETTDNGILAFTQSNQVLTTFNATCERLFNEERNNVLGLTLEVVASENPRLRSFLECANLDALSTPKMNQRYECHCTFDNQLHTFFISVSKLNHSGASGEQDTLVVFNDVTEKRLMQQQLVRSEKSKVAGELAAGFAHEIRNPLSTIKGFLQVFQKEEQKESKKDQFDLMVKEIDRVNKIIKDLLNMANPSDVIKEKTNLSDILSSMRKMYSTEAAKRGIDVTFCHDSELPGVWVDADKVQQVMINLVKNGMDSMPEGGELTIRAYESDSKSVEILVQDSGEGMGEDIIDKIGTPFFTTKHDGTGLGLMTSFQIVEELDGTLTVESEQGKGTCFTLKLPIYLSDHTKNQLDA
ncbi:sensor histidine kinase [Alkalicoccobacillus murimartini]|uniref:histidine kinase n=1 Tax=Alkalicoccobacillus murimartini TaxID=171685 RepID=A0ABT9YEF2_9BACI|nr:PAS domain-containing sensor histidine kinase [Alkalicoccobacillus murimartini]MDQ0205424.1 nitrogen-specific signal transduction histidine kinase [Alkalicoccobacillus murimartini]